MQHSYSLGNLANPQEFNDKLQLPTGDHQQLLSDLQMMIRIREVEEQIAQLVRDKEVGCPCHLAIGQEAIAVGISRFLRKTDQVFGGHRSHGHFLALGGSVTSLFAEVFGKVTGCSRGMGGSMHLRAPEIGFEGSVPIVGATIPIAVGSALAAKLAKTDDIAVSYFGDGAAEEGVFHESLNLASTKNLPVLFVCENNLYSSHLDIKLRQPADRVARFADAHCIKSNSIDGNDLTEVLSQAKELIDSIRAGGGPAFLEAVTYRWKGHVGPNEDIDVGVRRSETDLRAWKKRDPIVRLKGGLIDAGMINEERFIQMEQAIIAEVTAAREAAFNQSMPEVSQMMEVVYSERS